jgi:hypothetical protein
MPVLYRWECTFRKQHARPIRCTAPLELERIGEEAFILNGERIAWPDTHEVRCHLHAPIESNPAP